MAEIAILLVIKKIGIAVAGETLKFAGPLLAKKSELVASLPNDMKLMKKELELVHAFLKESGRKVQKGEVMETWTGQVRGLAYDMEDIVDQFIYVVGKHNQKGSWWNYVKKIVKRPQSLFSLDEIASEVKRINQELRQLSERRDRWAGQSDGGTDIPAENYETKHVLYLPGQDYSIKDDELAGIDKNRKTLIESLDSNDPSLRIISVWGMGGIGKSTLVNNVYKSVASNFDCCAWVSVSQSYKLEDIWKKMLTDLIGKDKKEFDPEALKSAELRMELTKILDKKKYLIILDDVWTDEAFRRIVAVLVDNGNGSRVIITTRSEEVASRAEDGCKIKVKPLNDKDAWHIFCRKAFPKVENHICPSELYNCGKDIVEKCAGLPLALVAIGSILSLKTKSDKEWRLFYNQLIWELHSNENLNHVEKILNLSYKYLPDYLKNCFLYCAMFPEDYLIHRKRLTRLWVAEGFIEQKGASSLEDIAEVYLGELVRRSMIQVVKRNSFGRIKCLRMHDLVRELAIVQSRKESFSATYDDNHGEIPVGLDSRRISVLQCSKANLLTIDPSRLRTFITFDTSMALSSWYSIYSKSKYLTVLDLSGSPIEVIPISVGELFNLRLLCLDDTKVKELPKSITKLQNLQSLSAEHAQLLKFPRGLSKLKRLQYLNTSRLQDATYRSFIYLESLEPFKGLWNLSELQRLGSIKATAVLVAKLGNLSQLRCLEITDVRTSHCSQLCNSLSNMHQLTSLLIRACNEDELLQLDNMTFPNPLEKLYLEGRLSEGTMESPFFSIHGNAVRLIELSYSQLNERQLSRVSDLSNLTELWLAKAYTGQQLHFFADGFQKLKEIYLWDLPSVSQICIDEGALVNLENLSIRRLQELRELPVGVSFLMSLKKASFIGLHPDFARNIREEQLYHIPNVYM